MLLNNPLIAHLKPKLHTLRLVPESVRVKAPAVTGVSRFVPCLWWGDLCAAGAVCLPAA